MRSPFLFLAVAASLLPARATAQTAYSIDLGAITAFDDATLEIGFRAAPSTPNRAGADILLATFPDALIHGLLLLSLDVDVTHGVALNEQLTLFPRFGGSLLAASGGGGGGGAWGYNVGAGLLGRVSPTMGARLDYTHHRFTSGGETLPLTSITIGFVWMH